MEQKLQNGYIYPKAMLYTILLLAFCVIVTLWKNIRHMTNKTLTKQCRNKKQKAVVMTEVSVQAEVG